MNTDKETTEDQRQWSCTENKALCIIVQIHCIDFLYRVIVFKGKKIIPDSLSAWPIPKIFLTM